MTQKEAAIVSAYTGYLIGSFDEMHKYIEELMDRPVMTHEMGSKDIADEIRRKSKEDFIKIKITKGF